MFGLPFILFPFLWAKPIELAKVNGSVIAPEDVEAIRKTDPQLSPRTALERCIEKELVTQEAKRSGIDSSAEVRLKIQDVLSDAYFRTQSPKWNEEADESQAKTLYEASPLVRLKHLVLLTRTPSEKNEATKRLKTIRQRLKKGEDFTPIVLSESQAESARWGGDLDFRGANTLPEQIYRTALKLKKKEVSQPIDLGDSIHIVQRIDSKSYADAPATYTQYLRYEWKKRNREELRQASIKELTKKATIEWLDKSR